MASPKTGSEGIYKEPAYINENMRFNNVRNKVHEYPVCEGKQLRLTL